MGILGLDMATVAASRIAGLRTATMMRGDARIDDVAVPAPCAHSPTSGSWGALAAEAMGAAESGELPGAAGEAEALLISRHHQLAQEWSRPCRCAGPQIQQQAGAGRPRLVETLKGRVAAGLAGGGLRALWNAPLFIQQDEVIAPQHEPEGLFGRWHKGERSC